MNEYKSEEDYEICKQACKEAGCYLPESNVFYSEIANTPNYLRAYYEKKGRNKFNYFDNYVEKEWGDAETISFLTGAIVGLIITIFVIIIYGRT